MQRVLLTRSAFDAYPDLEYRRQLLPRGAIYSYSATVAVEGYESRRVVVRFDSRYPNHPAVLVDGPDDSPHRFPTRNGRGRLCLWFPHDPSERRWVPQQGLHALFGMIVVHLFEEAWWAETGVWLGDEYPHDDDEQTTLPEAA